MRPYINNHEVQLIRKLIVEAGLSHDTIASGLLAKLGGVLASTKTGVSNTLGSIDLNSIDWDSINAKLDSALPRTTGIDSTTLEDI